MRQFAIRLIAAMALAVLLAGCERAKTKLDREVDRLCAIDGGVHIYEKVTLPNENFGPDGEVFPQYRGCHGKAAGTVHSTSQLLIGRL